MNMGNHLSSQKMDEDFSVLVADLGPVFADIEREHSEARDAARRQAEANRRIQRNANAPFKMKDEDE